MNLSLFPSARVTAPAAALIPVVEILRCPRCDGRMGEAEQTFVCHDCSQRYPITDGIPQLFVPNDWGDGKLDVTDIVKDFYEETPFPDYDDVDSRETLRQKARLGVFARILDEQIPPDVLMLEVGSGTGQLTNFPGMDWSRRAIGADLCMNSLKLTNDFRDRFGIVNADFLQMNLFQPPFADACMDVVISNGVLHHTGHTLPENFDQPPPPRGRQASEPRLNTRRSTAWFRDEYRHPHENKHSIDEVRVQTQSGRVPVQHSIHQRHQVR